MQCDGIFWTVVLPVIIAQLWRFFSFHVPQSHSDPLIAVAQQKKRCSKPWTRSLVGWSPADTAEEDKFACAISDALGDLAECEGGMAMDALQTKMVVAAHSIQYSSTSDRRSCAVTRSPEMRQALTDFEDASRLPLDEKKKAKKRARNLYRKARRQKDWLQAVAETRIKKPLTLSSFEGSGDRDEWPHLLKAKCEDKYVADEDIECHACTPTEPLEHS